MLSHCICIVHHVIIFSRLGLDNQKMAVLIYYLYNLRNAGLRSPGAIAGLYKRQEVSFKNENFRVVDIIRYTLEVSYG
jgi:hypothetical protein